MAICGIGSALRRASALLLCVACSGAPVEIDDARHFRAGLVPAEAAAQAIAEFEAAGFQVGARVDRPDFSAFGVEDGEGRTRVRVVTMRGWVLAVDAPSAEHSRPAVRLDPRALDFDGDGNEEILVAAQDAARDVECHAIVGFDDARAVERRVDFASHGGEGCVVGADAEDRLLGRVFYPELSRGVVPSLHLVLGARFSVESARPVHVAGPDSDESRGYRWAQGVEAAARAFVLGESADQQRQALQRTVDCTAYLEECALVRERIDRAWAPDSE